MPPLSSVVAHPNPNVNVSGVSDATIVKLLFSSTANVTLSSQPLAVIIPPSGSVNVLYTFAQPSPPPPEIHGTFTKAPHKSLTYTG